MRRSSISRGGQVSIPADVRRRWGTSVVLVEDRGESLVLRPVPDDPVRAAIGSLAGSGPTSDAARTRLRAEEAAAEDRRHRPRTPRPRRRA